MAGSSSTLTSRSTVSYGIGAITKRMEKLTIDFVGDSGTGAIPTLDITFAGGFLIQAITNPGSTAPTDNWDFTLISAEGGDLGAAGLADRDTSNSEVKIFDPAPFLEGVVTVTFAGNSVNSATGRVILYVSDER